MSSAPVAREGWRLRRESVKAKVHITLKSGVLDPQGKAIEKSLEHLGFDGVGEVRQGKVIEIELAETDAAKAREAVDAMCRKLLANTVIENYAIELS
jgi:phosphoribosylformylglycinamidine synthase